MHIIKLNLMFFLIYLHHIKTVITYFYSKQSFLMFNNIKQQQKLL